MGPPYQRRIPESHSQGSGLDDDDDDDGMDEESGRSSNSERGNTDRGPKIEQSWSGQVGYLFALVQL